MITFRNLLAGIIALGKSEKSNMQKSNMQKSNIQRFQSEVRDAVEILDFAISEGRPVADEIIQHIKRAEQYLEPEAKLPEDSLRVEFEKAYRDLAQFMKPINISTLRATQDGYAGISRMWLTRSWTSSDAKLYSKKLWFWILVCVSMIVAYQRAMPAPL